MNNEKETVMDAAAERRGQDTDAAVEHRARLAGEDGVGVQSSSWRKETHHSPTQNSNSN